MERRGGGFIRNEGEAECLRGVEAEGTTLTAHKMGSYGRGRARKNRAQRASSLALFLRTPDVISLIFADSYLRPKTSCMS